MYLDFIKLTVLNREFQGPRQGFQRVGSRGLVCVSRSGQPPNLTCILTSSTTHPQSSLQLI